jgi:hypothetical protein
VSAAVDPSAGTPRPAGRHPWERLLPGEHCRLTEEAWYALLESHEPLHQWGSCFLVDGGPGAPVWLYWRDPGGTGRHTAACLDAARSARAREGVAQLEAAARRVADLLAAARTRGGSNLEQIREEQQASAAWQELGETLYRELLPLRPRC